MLIVKDLREVGRGKPKSFIPFESPMMLVIVSCSLAREWKSREDWKKETREKGGESQQQLLILNICSARYKIHDHWLKSSTEGKEIKRDFKNNATPIRKSTINSQTSLRSPDTQRTQDYSPHLSQSSGKPCPCAHRPLHQDRFVPLHLWYFAGRHQN
jgi:hypothetical protein